MSGFDLNISVDLIDNKTLSDLEATSALVAYLEQQLELGSGKAGYLLGMLTAGGWVIGSPQVTGVLENFSKSSGFYIRAFPLLHDEAIAGDGPAMLWLAQYYQCGLPPLERPVIEMFWFWVGRAKQTDWGRSIQQF